MRRAHVIARTLQGHYHARMSYSLRLAHLEYRLGMLSNTSVQNIETIAEVFNPDGITNRRISIFFGHITSEINRMLMVANKGDNTYKNLAVI